MNENFSPDHNKNSVFNSRSDINLLKKNKAYNNYISNNTNQLRWAKQARHKILPAIKTILDKVNDLFLTYKTTQKMDFIAIFELILSFNEYEKEIQQLLNEIKDSQQKPDHVEWGGEEVLNVIQWIFMLEHQQNPKKSVAFKACISFGIHNHTEMDDMEKLKELAEQLVKRQFIKLAFPTPNGQDQNIFIKFFISLTKQAKPSKLQQQELISQKKELLLKNKNNIQEISNKLSTSISGLSHSLITWYGAGKEIMLNHTETAGNSCSNNEQINKNSTCHFIGWTIFALTDALAFSCGLTIAIKGCMKSDQFPKAKTLLQTIGISIMALVFLVGIVAIVYTCKNKKLEKATNEENQIIKNM